MELKQIGKYEIVQKLGEGGFGSVFLAINTRLKKNVALKVLHPQVASDERLALYFEREAHALARMDHVNIVRVYDYDQIDGVSFIVMEYIDGTNLDRLLKENHSFPLDQTVVIFRQLLSALGYAHDHGVIHRDIKPSNIMLTNSGEVKITDFGIAKVAGGAKLTKTGAGAGSLLYMSPEQIKGVNIDNRSDLYSVGVTLYQVAVGRTPFEADSDYEIMTGHLDKAPPSPSQFNADVPRELEQIILKALEKKPEKRYQNAFEMSEALGRIKVTYDKTVAQPVGAFDKTVSTAQPPPPPPPSWKKWLVAAVAVAAVIVLAFFIFRGGGKTQQTTATFADSLKTALGFYDEKKYDAAATLLSQLSKSSTGSEDEKVTVNQYLAASRLMSGDSVQARALLTNLYHDHPQTTFSPDRFPPQIVGLWDQLGKQRVPAALGSVEITLQNYQPFAPVMIYCGSQSKSYHGEAVKFADLKDGKYDIRVEGTGMENVKETVQIKGDNLSRTFALEKQRIVTPAATGSLAVTVENYKIFEPVTVIFDKRSEEYKGTPLVFDNIASGPHEVTVSTDVGTLTDQVTIQGDRQERVFTLSDHSSSKLTITSLVEGNPGEIVAAQVYIDNKKIEDGETPLNIKLMNGPHKIWIEHKDYRTVGSVRYVDLKKDTPVEFVLRKK